MAKGVSVVIQATDRASATIEGINKRLRGIAAPGERFSKALGKLADTSGLTAAARGVSTLARSTAAAAESLGRFAPALGALTGLGTIAGLASLSGRFAEFGTRLGLDARRIGTTADRLHGLQGAARLAGASAEDLTGGMRALGDTLFNATSGRAPEAAVLFSQLGVAFRDSRTGAARLAEDVLPELANKIAGIRNPTLQAQIATELFGGAGEALLPFLRKGAAGMAEYRREAERYGVMNQRGVDAANDLRMAQTRLGLAVEGVGYAVAERLAPVLVPALTRLSDWVASHREDISAFFERVAKGLVSWVEGGGIERTIGSLEDFGRKVNDVVQFFGGWEKAALGLGVALTASVLAPLVQIAAKMAYFAAWQAPRWMLTLLGMGSAAASATTAAGLAMGAAGAYAGHRNMPITDDMGNIVGNSGGQGGEERWKAYNDTLGKGPPQTFWGTIQRLFGFGGQSGGRGYGADSRGERYVGSGANAPAIPGDRQQRGQSIHDDFIRQGLPEAQAWGAASNALHENFGQVAGTTGDGGRSRGMFQWNGPRRAEYIRQYGHEPNEGTQSENVAFMAWELRNTEAANARRFMAARDARSAAAAMSADVIRPKAVLQNMQERGATAQELAARGRAGVPPDAAPPVQAPPAPLPPAPAGAPGANGTANLQVSFANAPPGMSHSVTTSGDVTMGGIGLSRPMVGMGTLP